MYQGVRHLVLVAEHVEPRGAGHSHRPCTALPAQLGLVIIGGEGALLIGALAATSAALIVPDAPPIAVQLAMAFAGMTAGGLWIALSGALQHYRGVNETISSLLLVYIALAFSTIWSRGRCAIRQASTNRRRASIGAANMIGTIPGLDVHWGLVFGIVAAVLAYILIFHTVFGFAARIAGGNVRAAKVVGLGVGRLISLPASWREPCAGLAGMVEVAAVQGRANASLVSGYGFTGILVAFLRGIIRWRSFRSRSCSAASSPAGGLLQRRLDLPDATVLVLQGIDLRRRCWLARRFTAASQFSRSREPDDGMIVGVHRSCRFAILGGALRVSTPFMFVSLGECMTEKSGRINLGLEGTLVMGAMCAYAHLVSDRLALARRARGRRRRRAARR